jgi:hypothetical protein
MNSVTQVDTDPDKLTEDADWPYLFTVLIPTNLRGRDRLKDRGVQDVGGYEVTGMILLRDLMGAMRFYRSKDVSVHVFNLHQLRFQRIKLSYVEAVALIRCVCTRAV